MITPTAEDGMNDARSSDLLFEVWKKESHKFGNSEDRGAGLRMACPSDRTATKGFSLLATVPRP